MGKDGSGEPSFMVKLLYKYAVEAAGVSLHGAKGGKYRQPWCQG